MQLYLVMDTLANGIKQYCQVDFAKQCSDIGNSELSNLKFGYSKKETGRKDEIDNCFEQKMNDNQKDEVICEGSKSMRWSASDMSTARLPFAHSQHMKAGGMKHVHSATNN